MKNTWLKTTVLSLCALSCAFLFTAPLHAESLRTVALEDRVAPGISPGKTFSSFEAPLLNNSGAVAFRGWADGKGIWSEGGGSLALVAHTSVGIAPGSSPGVGFSSLGEPVLIDSGKVAFFGILDPPLNNRGIWSDVSGSMELVVRSGVDSDAAGGPGLGAGVEFHPQGESFKSVFIPVLNGAGKMAFLGRLTGTGVNESNEWGIWSKEGGSLSLVARIGTSDVPGIPEARFSSLGTPVLNSSGKTVFSAILAHGLGGVNYAIENNRGIWSDVSGSMELVVRSGVDSDAAGGPGLGAGVKFERVGSPIMNGSGKMVFGGSIKGSFADYSGPYGYGIWSKENGRLTRVASAGTDNDALGGPGLGAGIQFSFFANRVLNDAGKIAFEGYLEGTGTSNPQEYGIWSEEGGSLTLIARSEADDAPGTSPGVKFSNFKYLVLNGSGMVAFYGYLTGTDVGGSNDRGIWAQDTAGNLILIAREGDQLDVDDGPGIDLRTIDELSFVGGGGSDIGSANGFNDLGQVAFKARFTDRTEGVFVSNIAAVPEPSSLAIALLGCFALIATRRRQEASLRVGRRRAFPASA